MLKLYLIRHGETDYNKPGIFFGNKDVGLNQIGKKQSEELEKAMDNIELDVIISSPLRRCIETAQGIASRKGLVINVVDELREMDFGLWERYHYDDVARIYPAEWKKGMEDWRNMHPSNGECFKDFYSRVSNAIRTIIESYDGKNVMVKMLH